MLIIGQNNDRIESLMNNFAKSFAMEDLGGPVK